jgi:HSP20 family protein
MKKGPTGTAAIGEILKGLGQLVEKLGEIDKVGDPLNKSNSQHHSGSLRGSDGKTRGVFGVQVKVGLGGKEIEIEPFGNVKPGFDDVEAMVHETREPVCDVFEEEAELLIVAEMPGVAAEDVKLLLEGDLLSIRAERRDRKYSKELQLPRVVAIEKAKISANNGVVEIRCPL